MENRAEFHENVKIVNQSATLDSDKLFIYAKPIPAGDKITEPKDDSVPDRIKINDKFELDHIDAIDNVVVERPNDGDFSEKAYGNLGVYTVSQKKIILYGTDKTPPIITRGKNILTPRENGKVVVDLEEESAYIAEGADVEIRDRGKRK